jgi:hypothetical protein
VIKPLPVLALVSLVAVAPPVRAQTAGKASSEAQSSGTREDGVYRSHLTGIEIALPPDWVVESQAPASQRGAQVVELRNLVSNQVATLWMKRRNADAADIPALMSQRLDAKAAQRNSFQGYKYRTQSVRHSTIGGRPALSVVADYVSAGRSMAEYLTWIDGEKSRIVFAARVPEAELEDLQRRFDPVIQSAVVP